MTTHRAHLLCLLGLRAPDEHGEGPDHRMCPRGGRQSGPWDVPPGAVLPPGGGWRA